MLVFVAVLGMGLIFLLLQMLLLRLLLLLTLLLVSARVHVGTFRSPLRYFVCSAHVLRSSYACVCVCVILYVYLRV